MRQPTRSGGLSRVFQLILLAIAAMTLLGAGDTSARFNSLGHKMICACGCNQILLECNHVGCTYSEGMRNELAANLDRGDSDELVLQAFVQKYGTTVLAAPTNVGFNRVAWLTPLVAFTLGIFGVAALARNWKLRPVPAPPEASLPQQHAALRERARQETEL